MDLDETIEKMRDRAISSNNVDVADRDSKQFRKIVNDIIAERDRYGSVVIPGSNGVKSKIRRAIRKAGYKTKEFTKKVITRGILRIPIIGRVLQHLYYVLVGNKKKVFQILVRLDNDELNLRNNNGRIDDLTEQLSNNDERYEQVITKLQDHDEYLKKIQLLMSEVSDLKAENQKLKAAIANGEAINAPIATTEYSMQKAESGEDEYSLIDYFDFENHFRGDRQYVIEAQKVYIPYFEGRKNVLDLGCGRGEFTELLVKNGIGVTGVDLYSPYVEYGKLNNLPVKHGDALEYLKNEDKVDGIFLGQVVEHMPINKVIELCNIAYAKLGDGDYLIMETPNPTSLVIFAESFYMDPSHNKPVHPRTLQYLVQKIGFSSVEILYTDGSKYPVKIPKVDVASGNSDEFNAAMERVEQLLYGSQDYAIIARK